MNGTFAAAKQLASAVQPTASIDTIICPPYIHLDAVNTAKQAGVKLGAQDTAATNNGAYTGDISAAQLSDAGAEYVIIGHSERRGVHGEDTPILLKKFERAFEAGLKVIYCCGETQLQRSEGMAEQTVLAQLQGVQAHLTDTSKVIIAYEPVWAIGTGISATPDDAQTMHGLIRKFVEEKLANGSDMRILYGGSVKPETAHSLASQADIDGFLVGGASLEAKSFTDIGAALAEAKSKT